jgi:hypothetical protein
MAAAVFCRGAAQGREEVAARAKGRGARRLNRGTRLGVSSSDADAWRRRTPAESRRRPVRTAGWARMGFARAVAAKAGGCGSDGLDQAKTWAGWKALMD